MARAANTSRDDVRRVLVAGDTHGNTVWVEGLLHTAAQHGCPIVIQVGGFGYFPDLPDGPRFLTAVNRMRVALGGLMFGFLGGAFSVDRRDRTHGIDW